MKIKPFVLLLSKWLFYLKGENSSVKSNRPNKSRGVSKLWA